MREPLSEKEILFFTEFAEILLKYNVMLQCGKTGNIEVLVFGRLYEDSFITIPFTECLDETDIEWLLKEEESRDGGVELRDGGE